MATPKKTVQTKSDVANKEKNEATLKTAANLTIDAAAKKVTEAQLSIGKTLSDVTSKLQEQLQELTTVSQAVELKKAELSNIYGTEQVLKNIDELKADFENQKATIDLSFAAYEQESAAKQASLELERNKDQEQFDYEMEQSRRSERLAHEENLRVAAAAERDRKEQIERGFKERDENLKKAENELVVLRTQVQGFPAEIDAAVKKAEAIVGNTIKREYEHKLSLLQKDFDTSQLVANNTIKSLNDRLVSQDNVIGQLQVRLGDADRRVTEIATKALEAASSTKSLADVQNLIQTQNNGTSARKA